MDGYALEKSRRRAGESKAASWRVEQSSTWLAKPRKGGSCLPFLLSSPAEETFPVGVPEEGPVAALGLLSSNLGLLSFAYLGLQGIRLDEEPLITHSVNIRKTTKLFT